MGAAAPAARAGTYDVYACDTPAGTSTNHSWALAVSGPPQFATTTCSAAGQALSLSSNANQLYDPGVNATMTFTAPSGATIADFRLHRLLFEFDPVDNDPGRAKLYNLGQLGGTAFELSGHNAPVVANTAGLYWCGGGEACQDDQTVTRASFTALAGYRGDATFLRYTTGCATVPCTLWTNGASPPGVGSILTQIFGAVVTVNDPTKPTVDRIAPTGLAAAGPVGGDEPVAFDAGDNSGIKAASLVDVTPGAAEQVVGTHDFACDYSYAAPCPQAAGAEITPSGLKAGSRQLKLRVTDAGGNVGESAAFTVQVAGAANGFPPDPSAKLTATFARNRHKTIDVPFGGRASIRGRLTDAAGTPIAGATIQALDRALSTRTAYAQRLEVTTAADGTFSVLPGKGTARAIRFEYRFRKLLGTASVSTRVELRVAAGSTLKVSPKRVRPQGTITISGRLRGLPLPRSGKVVDLQAFEGGKWRTFDTTRARTNARFTSRYRFLRAGSGSSFLIRARIRRDDSYPYYLGYSPRVRVRVR
jgi:hypothetical protein